MKRVALIGSASFAQQIVNTIEYDSSESMTIVGYFDDYEKKGTIINGYPILGKINDVFNLYVNNAFDCVFIAIGYKHFSFKEGIYNSIKNRIPLANIICKTAYVHPTAKLGEGILIKDYAIINQNAIIEDNVCITLRSIVNHDSFVDKHTFFSTNVSTAGNVKIGKRCFIGIGSIVSDGIKIDDDVWLSPGSVIIKDIKEPGHYISHALRISKIIL